MAGTATAPKSKAAPKSKRGAKTKTSNEEVAKRNAAKKAEREEAAQAKKAEREKAKQAERDAAIKAGTLIVGDDGREFHKVEKEDLGTVETRATGIVKALKESKVPVLGRDLMAEFGGGWPQYLSIFALLKVEGLVEEYRVRGGKAGTSGVAYRWVGK